MAGTPNPSWGLWLAFVACFFDLGNVQTSGAAEGPGDFKALMNVKATIDNWDLYQQRSLAYGWREDFRSNLCQWTGVRCWNGTVGALKFPTNASSLHGNITNFMVAASQIQNLHFIDVSDQFFSGTLPTGALPNGGNLSFSLLTGLNLARNNIKGTLPEEWGITHMFPSLRRLNLSGNQRLSGSLPPSWGSETGSFQNLAKFDAASCALNGSLPEGWPTGLPALADVNLSSNALTGTLPATWASFGSLQSLKLDRNNLTGPIPAEYGLNGTLANLTWLSLYANRLTGSIPAEWAAWKNSSAAVDASPVLPRLQWMDVANNLLSGPVPDFGSASNGSSPPILIANGNNFCGIVPSSLSVWDCSSFCVNAAWQDCSANGTAPPLAPVPKLPTVDQATSPDMAVLVNLTKVFINWDVYARTQNLNWRFDRNVCDWTPYVGCQGHNVVSLDFSLSAIDVTGIHPTTPQGLNYQNVHFSSPIRLQGDVGQVLTVLQRLPSLTTLNLASAFLTGSIPKGLNLPSLQNLILRDNDIKGELPAYWGYSAVPALRTLDLSSNDRVSGSLPESAWGSGGGLQTLTELDFGGCNLTGSLPHSWGSVLPALSTLELTYNSISGTLPLQWASSPLQKLLLTGNNISGTLPGGWGSNGSWSKLTDLELDRNSLSGTLPPHWSAGGFSSLRHISLTSNLLTGSIPAAWGAPQAFSKWWSLALQPQQVGYGLCGPSSPRIQVQQWTWLGQTFSPVDLPPCASLDPAPDSPHNQTGAIAGGVIGALAALAGLAAVVACFVVRQRRQKRAVPATIQATPFAAPMAKAMSGDEVIDPFRRDMETGLHDSDNIIVPPKMCAAPASMVPFCQAPSSINHSQGAQRSGSLSQHSESLGQRGESLGHETYFASQGSGYSSEPAREGDKKPETLPHMFAKDWMLNLDALEIELDEDGNEVELGKGAFGVVVKGRYRLSPVAVKRLLNQTPEQQAQFLKEMAILRACRSSRYIVPFVGASLLPGNTILAMDYMENGNLWDQLPRTNKAGQHIFQWKFRGKKIAYEIALGLHCLHDLKVVHLDLKSCNVLIDSDGSAKISDVGLAALMSHNYLSQMAPTGTWSWVAPEVILGGKVTSKADIYSFGVVIWEICTLERPAWRGMLRDIRVPEEAPQEIADLVVRCMGDQESRPSAGEIAEILAVHAGRRGPSRTTSRSSSLGTPKLPSAGQPKVPSWGSAQGSSSSNPPTSGSAGQPNSSSNAAPKSSGSNPPVSGTAG